MEALVTHRDFYGVDETFCNGVVCASRVHTRIFQPAPQPARRDGVLVWLDGEFLNGDELRARYRVNAAGDPDLLGALYSGADEFSFLRDVDGHFTAVVYDGARARLHLIADRYGFRHLYWSDRGGRVAWASEVKAFLRVPGFDVVIDGESVDLFFSVGHFAGDGTWFAGVEVRPAATVLTWNLADGPRTATRYWTYDEIRTMDPVPAEDEIIEEWGRLFEESVARCCRDGRVGALLSGGLDSRAVVAAFPRERDPVQVVTFGQPRSDDVEIARRVARVRGAEHHVYLFDEKTWLADRFQGVWLTDGQSNIVDLHGAFTLEPRREWFDINVSGFIGDLNMGGSYVRETPQDEYDAMQNRVRRFTTVGLRAAQTSGENRLPFVGNALLEYSFSIPGALRNHHHLFNKLLLRKYPEYYRSIPWQKTGVPISWPHRLADAARTWGKAVDRVQTVLPGIASRRRRHMASYGEWMRNEPARPVFERILTHPDALYPSYLRDVDVPALWRRHLSGERLGFRIGLHFTFELWLQQVFNAKYREGPGASLRT